MLAAVGCTARWMPATCSENFDRLSTNGRAASRPEADAQRTAE